ncbi:transglutaminase-like cysteine peptidase [Micavibrio aeruginosavorus]|uniref:Uncharacterized domain protein n=1 Tax=Micavibrio aeruginosavorus (strain ARL-13) TaxID=856793 RepID=G2KMG3_MICAA|nr:transglutaminase-like cysteine peptidase [Micavibrio aeruginosavorus]AEP10656.1 putative uncharacterized domain protein [Micavibrio aeruginosavorus ARL-13]
MGFESGGSSLKSHSQGGVLNRIKVSVDRNRLGEVLVYTGALTPQELRYALARQKTSGASEPLGRVLLRERMIRRQDLYRALAQQMTLRLMAASLAIALGFTMFGIKRANAASVRDLPAQVTLASVANSAFTPVNYYPNLFGANEKQSTNLKPFTKWTDMFVRFETAMGGASAKSSIKTIKAEIEPLQGLPLDAMAARVNTIANAVRYIEDKDNYGNSDYWATPVEFFARGGDCEDYAIAKYTMLRALGVPESRLRIAIVHDLQKNIPHAVLVVYTDDGALILDNQNKSVRTANSLTSRYRPIFSINRDAWWLHNKPQGTVLASAQ